MTETKIYDTEITPSLPREVTAELLTDVANLSNLDESKRLFIFITFLDHYAKKGPQAVGSKWLWYHQQVIVDFHEALVERYGEDLNRDVAVFNSLLNAYGRVELFDSVIQVWNEMLNMNIRIDLVSVSIIFDQCGRRKRLPDAKKIFGWLQHSERFLEVMDQNQLGIMAGVLVQMWRT